MEAKFLFIVFNWLILRKYFMPKDWLSVDKWVQKHGQV